MAQSLGYSLLCLFMDWFLQLRHHRRWLAAGTAAARHHCCGHAVRACAPLDELDICQVPTLHQLRDLKRSCFLTPAAHAEWLCGHADAVDLFAPKREGRVSMLWRGTGRCGACSGLDLYREC